MVRRFGRFVIWGDLFPIGKMVVHSQNMLVSWLKMRVEKNIWFHHVEYFLSIGYGAKLRFHGSTCVLLRLLFPWNVWSDDDECLEWWWYFPQIKPSRSWPFIQFLASESSMQQDTMCWYRSHFGVTGDHLDLYCRHQNLQGGITSTWMWEERADS